MVSTPFLIDGDLIFLTWQRDATGLTAENRELKLRLQAMEQQAHLRDGTSLNMYSITYHVW